MFPEDLFECNSELKEYIYEKKGFDEKIEEKYTLARNKKNNEKIIKKMNPVDREVEEARLRKAFMEA